LPIPIDKKEFETFNEAVKYLMDTRGFSEDTAKGIVGKIESNLTKSKASSMLPTFQEDSTGRYATFFLINDQWNEMDWKVSKSSIPQYIHTFEGMPYISEPKLQHFGMSANDPVSKTLVQQEQFRAGDIIKAKMAASDTAEVLVKFDDTPLGNQAWKEMKNGEAIYVSPAVVGIANFDQMGRVEYDVWHGLHLARVENPAYGVAVASIKQTCEGPRSTCINNLFKNAIASGKIKNDSFKLLDSNNNELDPTKSLQENEIIALKASVEKLTKLVTSKADEPPTPVETETETQACPPGYHKSPEGNCVPDVQTENDVNTSAANEEGTEEECEDGTMIDGKCVKDAIASIKDPVAKKLIQTLIGKVASHDNEKKESIASQLTEMRIKAGTASSDSHQENMKSLMRMSLGSLVNTYNNEAPLLDKIIAMSGSSPISKKITIHTPESSSSASRTQSINSIDEMEGYL